MKHFLLLSAACLVALGMPTPSTAQESTEQQTPYWYASYFSIDWTRTDSLTKLWKLTEPVRELQKENGEILEWLGLVHHTGNEQNVVVMTKYPSWKAINAQSDALESVFPNAAERARLNDGFNWVFGAAPHQDVIYRESPGAIMPSAEDPTEDTFWYAAYYEIPLVRTDSLNKLWAINADVAKEAKRNGSILGTVSLVHHTGVHHATVVTLTKYPSWEALEVQSWNGAQQAVEPDSSRRAEINAGFTYVFQDEGTGLVPHYDVIYIQPTK